MASKPGSSRKAAAPPGAATAFPVAASTRPSSSRASPAQVLSSVAVARPPSTASIPSSNVLQTGSSPSRRALWLDSASKEARPASASSSTVASEARASARRDIAFSSPAAASGANAGSAALIRVSSATWRWYILSCSCMRPDSTSSTAASASRARPTPISRGSVFAARCLSRLLGICLLTPLAPAPHVDPCRNAGLSTSFLKLKTGHASVPRRNDPAR